MTEGIVPDRTIYERIDAARQTFPAVVKGATGQVGTRTYLYADINAVVDGVEDSLRLQGVGIFPYMRYNEVVTELRVLSYAGPPPSEDPDPSQVVSCAISLPGDLTPQQVGSAITYFRRYALVLLLNLLAEDDDGSAASNEPRTRQAEPPVAVLPPPPSAPAGWDSDEQSLSAHNDLRERILALPAEFGESCIAFRTEHGWPLPLALFEELEGIVRVAEGFKPEA